MDIDFVFSINGRYNKYHSAELDNCPYCILIPLFFNRFYLAIEYFRKIDKTNKIIDNIKHDIAGFDTSTVSNQKTGLINCLFLVDKFINFILIQHCCRNLLTMGLSYVLTIKNCSTLVYWVLNLY